MPDHQLHLVGLCGSLRKDSLNRKLLHNAAEIFGGKFTEANLRLPLYDGDLEAEGMPAEVTELGALIASADALIIASPEYNKAPTGVLKNALDWVSRLRPIPTAGKPLAIVSASPGRLGGARSQTMLRAMLLDFEVQALYPPEMVLASASGEFDDNAKLTNPHAIKTLTTLMDKLRAAAS